VVGGGGGRLGRSFAPASVVVLLNLFVLIGAGLLAYGVEQNEVRAARNDQREQVTREAVLLATRLADEVNSAFYLVAGLASYIGLQGEVSEEDYRTICSRLLAAKPELLSIAAAPGLINRYVYPLEGNEMAIGLDYRELPRQLAGILEVMETGRPLIAGPLELVQGGEAIIGRFPVFDIRPGREGEFWGIISTPMRTSVLYSQAGLNEAAEDLRISLRGRDGDGPAGAVFFGEAENFYLDAVVFDVELISGVWQLAALPRDGWTRTSPYRAQIFGAGALLTLLFLGLLNLVFMHLRRIELARRREMVAQVAKERFFSNMSHEIRTPLNGISGLADLIETSSDDEMTRESAAIIRDSAHALTRLLHDVLMLSDMNSAAYQPKCEEVEIGDLLNQMLSPLRPEIGRKELEVEVLPIPASCRVIPTDPLLLRQILWQLLANAVKFTDSGRVSVRVSSSARNFRIEISDTGIGIDADYLERIYNVFSQEDETDTRRHYGVGIGLAIVKRAVELLEGRIAVRSRKGEGSTFEVRLPKPDEDGEGGR